MESTAVEQQTTALAKVPRDIKDLLQGDQFKQAVRMALPKHLTADRFVRVAINATLRTPKLLQCNKESFFRALMDLSSYGLEPDGRRAHLIPFGQEVQLIIDYKGLVELVRRSGDVSYIHADVVYEGDQWEFKYGSEAKLIHRPNLERNGETRRIAFYSFVKLKDGSEDFMVMAPSQVDAIRKRSKAANNGPWVTDYDEMGKKTVFRRHSKWLPLSSETRDAIERDDEFAGIDIPATVGQVEFPDSAKQLPAPISLDSVQRTESQERVRKCRKCGGDGHDARNCPAKPEEAAPAVETAREPIGKGRPRHVESLEDEDPRGFAPCLEMGGKYYKPNADKSAWNECSQSEAEALSA